MNSSNQLLEKIKIIWEDLGCLYSQGAIYSERDLQAHFFRLFYPNQSKYGYKVWVEPTIFYPKNDESFNKPRQDWLRFKPDIIITEGNNIKVWIEFKFGGGGGSDLKKFEHIHKWQNVNNSFRLYPINLKTMDLQSDYKYCNKAGSLITILGRVSNGRFWVKNINKDFYKYLLIGEGTIVKKFVLEKT